MHTTSMRIKLQTPKRQMTNIIQSSNSKRFVSNLVIIWDLLIVFWRLQSGLWRPEEFVREGVLVLVVKGRPRGLDGIKPGRMDRLGNGEDEERKVD